MLLCLAAWGAQAAAGVDFRGQAASDAVRAVARWAVAERDARGLPFAIVDKKDARLYVFAASGRLLGATSALIGAAAGDESAPGIGSRPSSAIAPHERTTPAGRFDAEPGRNLDGEHVLWVDYDAGLAIHRLRPNSTYAARRDRLTSTRADERRVSLGCVVVPEAFYDAVVRPWLATPRGALVYVLPETEPAARWIAAWRAD